MDRMAQAERHARLLADFWEPSLIRHNPQRYIDLLEAEIAWTRRNYLSAPGAHDDEDLVYTQRPVYTPTPLPAEDLPEPPPSDEDDGAGATWGNSEPEEEEDDPEEEEDDPDANVTCWHCNKMDAPQKHQAKVTRQGQSLLWIQCADSLREHKHQSKWAHLVCEGLTPSQVPKGDRFYLCKECQRSDKHLKKPAKAATAGRRSHRALGFEPENEGLQTSYDRGESRRAQSPTPAPSNDRNESVFTRGKTPAPSNDRNESVFTRGKTPAPSNDRNENVFTRGGKTAGPSRDVGKLTSTSRVAQSKRKRAQSGAPDDETSGTERFLKKAHQAFLASQARSRGAHGTSADELFDDESYDDQPTGKKARQTKKRKTAYVGIKRKHVQREVSADESEDKPPPSKKARKTKTAGSTKRPTWTPSALRQVLISIECSKIKLGAVGNSLGAHFYAWAAEFNKRNYNTTRTEFQVKNCWMRDINPKGKPDVYKAQFALMQQYVIDHPLDLGVQEYLGLLDERDNRGGVDAGPAAGDGSDEGDGEGEVGLEEAEEDDENVQVTGEQENDEHEEKQDGEHEEGAHGFNLSTIAEGDEEE